MKKYLFVGLVMMLGLFIGSNADAAYIYFEPAQATKTVGERFTVNIRLNTEGQSINAVELQLSYPPLLRAISLSKAGSAVQLWVSEPSYTGSTISLTGGAPGGINSSGALLARVTFEGSAVGDGGLSLGVGSSVLLNDGQGTSVPLRLVANVFHITARSGGQTVTPAPTGSKAPSTNTSTPTPSVSDEPQEGDGDDTEKPKKFSISVEKDPRVFNGQYFLSFFTSDAGSGIKHYEIKEGDGVYKIGRTPYLLADQNLKSVIRVRAYDYAGNYRESVYPGVFKRFWLWIVNLF